jgi:hypothetical protein
MDPDWYWNHFGRHSAALWGWASDLFPFALTSAVMWAGAILAVFGAAKFLANILSVWQWVRRARIRNFFSFFRKLCSNRKVSAACMTVLALLVADAFLRTWARSERRSIPDRIAAPEHVRPEQVDALVEAALRRASMEFRENDYLVLTEKFSREEANRVLPEIYAALGMTGGRRVRRVKPLTGPWRVAMFSYGAYAGYSLAFEEAGMPPLCLAPAGKVHRHTTLFHEIAHGACLRESDADILAYLAMRRSRAPVLRALACLSLVYNSHWYPSCWREVRARFPSAVLEDVRIQSERADEAALRDYWVIWFSGELKARNIRLDETQYGGGPVFRGGDPFFRSVWALEKRAFMGDSLLWLLGEEERPEE